MQKQNEATHLKPSMTLVLVAALSLAGCASNSVFTPPSQTLTNLPPVERPQAMPGDRVYYANGRREKVVSVGAATTQIRRSSNYRYWLSTKDPLSPPVKVERKSGTSTTALLPKGESTTIWPLQVGNRSTFEAVRRKANSEKESVQLWNCAIESAEKITVVSGEFDTYRVECVRKSRSHKIKQRSTQYYAIDIGQVVLRIDRYPYKPAKKLELVAFKPDLSMLKRKSKARYRTFFQQVLTQVASGKTKSWWSRRSDTRIHVTPVNTLQFDRGGYCRNYLIRIDTGAATRRGAGMACRDGKGRWRTPRKVDAETGPVLK